MEHIGDRLIWYYVPGTTIAIPGGLNILTVFNTLVIMIALWGLLWLAVRRRQFIPSRAQYLVEVYVSGFENLVHSSLELEPEERNRRFFPLIGALFLFLVPANTIGFLPTGLFEEPAADINCTLALGIMAMTIATYCGVREKGAGGYFQELLGPLWSEKASSFGAAVAGKASALFFFPLNVIGEFAKVVSISFRLFGNIIGGSIIIVVVSSLVQHVLLPIPLDYFFIFFVGTVQAFVFTMLTLTYIAVAMK